MRAFAYQYDSGGTYLVVTPNKKNTTPSSSPSPSQYMTTVVQQGGMLSAYLGTFLIQTTQILYLMVGFTRAFSDMSSRNNDIRPSHSGSTSRSSLSLFLSVQQLICIIVQYHILHIAEHLNPSPTSSFDSFRPPDRGLPYFQHVRTAREARATPSSCLRPGCAGRSGTRSIGIPTRTQTKLWSNFHDWLLVFHCDFVVCTIWGLDHWRRERRSPRDDMVLDRNLRGISSGGIQWVE